MHIPTKTLGVAALALSLGMAASTGALAKGHGQGMSGDPGADVGSETAGPAQGLGAARGNGNGPADTPAGANPGNSENAGRTN